MFFEGGSFNSIDEKGRLVVPAKFREGLGQTFKLVKGFDKCIAVYTKERYEMMLQRLEEMKTSGPEGRKLVRHIIGCAQDCECDKQGRILIDQTLREYAGLKKDVFVTGLIDRIEIWDTEEYKKYEREGGNADYEHDEFLENALKLLDF